MAGSFCGLGRLGVEVRGRVNEEGFAVGAEAGGWPGILPAGDGFPGFAGFGGFPGFPGFGGFGSGELTVSVASGWVSMTGSFGNSWRRALRRSNSSMARR